MDDLAPELVALVASLGVLEPCDVIEWACVSKRFSEMLLGSDWILSRIQALNGLDWCCHYGTVQSMRLCLQDPDCDPSANGSNCLLIAIAFQPDAIGILLQDGRADPTVGESLCLTAAVIGSPKALKLLLEDGRADPTEGNSRYLYSAVAYPESLKLLLDDGRAKPRFGRSLFIQALQHDYAESLSVLLNHRSIEPDFGDPRWLYAFRQFGKWACARAVVLSRHFESNVPQELALRCLWYFEQFYPEEFQGFIETRTEMVQEAGLTPVQDFILRSARRFG